MKRKQINIITLLLIFFAGVLIFNSCKEDEQFPRTRLFQPVLNEDLYSEDNTIIVNLGKMKEAESYFIEVSRDSFATIDYSFEVDTNYFVINQDLIGEELLWFTIYQVQVTAIADAADYNSKPSFLGSVRTQKFPSNMLTPTVFDVTDTRAQVRWLTSGLDITMIKVFAENDLRLENPLLDFEVSSEDIAAEMSVISGLEPATTYQVAIYSGETLRGWELYTTKEAQVSGDNVYDLTGLEGDTITALADTLSSVVDGAIILLEGGKIYTTGGYAFDKSVTIQSGYSFVQALPTIECSSNFNITDGANVGYVHFKNIYFEGDFGANYVFNIDVSGTIGELKFESCKIHSLRGIARMKGGEGTLEKFTITDCVVDSINGYGVCYVDKDTWAAGDILLENSTFSKIQYFLASRSNTNSITIESCTLCEVPDVGRQMFRWRGGAGANDVLNGIKIYNCIFGFGWDMDAEETHAVKGIEGLTNTLIDIKNTYTTFDFSFSGNEIPTFPNFVYGGTTEELWVDPLVGLDFDFKDTGFAGKGDCGDPRWRIGL